MHSCLKQERFDVAKHQLPKVFTLHLSPCKNNLGNHKESPLPPCERGFSNPLVFTSSSFCKESIEDNSHEWTPKAGRYFDSD